MTGSDLGLNELARGCQRSGPHVPPAAAATADKLQNIWGHDKNDTSQYPDSQKREESNSEHLRTLRSYSMALDIRRKH